MSVHDDKWKASLGDGVVDHPHPPECLKQYPIGRILLYIKEYNDVGKKECTVSLKVEERASLLFELRIRGFDVTEMDADSRSDDVNVYLIRW